MGKNKYKYLQKAIPFFANVQTIHLNYVPCVIEKHFSLKRGQTTRQPSKIFQKIITEGDKVRRL